MPSQKPSAKEQQKINQFVQLAFEYNKKHNLFVRESKEQIHSIDVKESLEILHFTKKAKTLLDIGTGAGFPGMIIGLMQPQTEVTLAESSKKKTYFLKKTIKQLNAKNIKIVNEYVTKKSNLGEFDLITARAFAATDKIINTCRPFLKPKGSYTLLKGKKVKILEELKTINKNTYNYEIIKLDDEEKERHILLITNKDIE